MDYHGLWLSADYGTGHSRAKPKCTTYGSPMLSACEEFQVDVLELWGVGDPVMPKEMVSCKHGVLECGVWETQWCQCVGVWCVGDPVVPVCWSVVCGGPSVLECGVWETQ